MLEGFRVRSGELDALPQLGGGVCALDGLHVEVEGAGGGIGADCGVAGIGEGAGLTVAEASDVVLIAAEVLVFGGSGRGEMLVLWGMVEVGKGIADLSL